MSESGNFTILFLSLLRCMNGYKTAATNHEMGDLTYYSTVDELAVMFIQDSWIGFRTYETYVMIRALLSLIQNTCERVHSISSYTGLLG